MTNLLNSPHDLLNRQIEEAAKKSSSREYTETMSAHRRGFKEGAKWALEEFMPNYEALKRFKEAQDLLDKLADEVLDDRH